MLYIIIAVLLIVAALIVVILKKKQGGKSAGKLPAFGKKKGNKRKSSRHSDEEQEENISPMFERPVDLRSTSLSDEVRQNIEQLIRQGSYSAAEAQINQALHKNPTHQDLYLMLAEVHMHQDDEFALNQLIEHLRLSGLHSIVETIDAKKAVFKAQAQREHEQAKVSATTGSTMTGANIADFDQFNTPTNGFEQFNTPTTNNSFEQFNTPSSPSHDFAQFNSNNTPDFSQLNQNPTTTASSTDFDNILNTSAPASSNTMDFSFSEPKTSAPTTETSMDFSFSELASTPTTATSSMDFNFSESTPASVTESGIGFNFSESTPTPATETNMDFSFSEPTPVAETSMDFNFSEPTPTPVTETSMDFNFSEPAPTVAPPVAEVSESFDFNLNESATTPTPVAETNSFDFNFSEPTPVENKTNQGLDFNFSQIENIVTPSAPEAFDFSGLGLDSNISMPETSEPVVDVSEFLTATETVNEFANEELDYSNLNINNTSTSANVSSHTIENLDILEPIRIPEASVSQNLMTERSFSQSTDITSTTGADPLLQAFPTLANYQPAEVNLNLAEQYIKLGAYNEAQALLKDRQAFNAEQNRSAEILLQRLAS